MTDLKDFAIAAHGGLDRWNELAAVSARLLCGGVLWPLKGQGGVLDDVNVRVELHRQFASHFPFTGPGLRTAFTADRVAVETDAGDVLEERLKPRDSFAGHVLETPWDKLHLAYFAGYAIWTYQTAPFSFATPGYHTEELAPWREGGQTWRRLRVVFPDYVATHSKEQIFYFGDDGLVKRHDFTAEVVGRAGPAAHYITEYQEFDGIAVPTRHQIYAIDESGTVNPEPLLVSITLDEVTFA